MASSSSMEKLDVTQYFRKPESSRPMELVYGVVREPPAPRYAHQSVVAHLTALLDAHVREHDLGQVCVSPVDVILDEEAALVVQPDIIFIRAERLHIVRDRVWGPPDLVVEVLSAGTALRDRTTKLGWYRRYGVEEMWLVDCLEASIDVIALQTQPEHRARFSDETPFRSRVLPRWTLTVAQVLA